MIAPARVTGSKIEHAAPSRRRHRSVGTLETVVVQYGYLLACLIAYVYVIVVYTVCLGEYNSS